MGVQGGIAGTAHAVAERHADEPGSAFEFLAAFAALDVAGVLLKVGNALAYGIVEDRDHALARGLVAEGIEDRDRLRRGKADVVTKDRLDPLLGSVRALAIAGVRALEELRPADRVGALKNLAVAGGIDLAGQGEIGGKDADPLAGRLARLGVVVVAAFGDGCEPISSVPALDLRDADHRGEASNRGPQRPRKVRTGVPVHSVSAVGLLRFRALA